MELLLVQFLVLAFTGMLWWLARRDLKPPAPQDAAPGTADLEQLCATLEALVLDLERRAEEAMQRVDEAETRFSRITPLAPSAAPVEPLPEPAAAPEPAPPEEERDARYAPVYDLLDAGITDPGEIIRRTGLGQGEVNLILSLRARRAL